MLCSIFSERSLESLSSYSSVESLHFYNLFCFIEKKFGRVPVRHGKIPRPVEDKHVFFPKPLKSVEMISNNESPKEKALFLLD